MARRDLPAPDPLQLFGRQDDCRWLGKGQTSWLAEEFDSWFQDQAERHRDNEENADHGPDDGKHDAPYRCSCC